MRILDDTFNKIAVDYQNAPSYTARIVLNGQNIDETINDVSYESVCNDSDNISIGNAGSATVTFTIDSPKTNLANQEIEIYEDYYYYRTNTTYSLKLGVFKVMKPTIDRKKYSYNCVDKMTYLMELPFESELTFPANDTDIIQEICDKCGFEFVSKVEITPHIIGVNPGAMTRREYVGYLAGLQGANAIFNSDGNLEFRWYEVIDYTVDDNRIYQDGTDEISSELDFSLDYIKCSVPSTEEEITLRSGSDTATSGIEITNPLMTQEILDEVFEKIGGFTFRPASAEFLGDFRLEVGDIVTLNTDDTNYTVPIMNVTHNSDGIVKTNIEAVAKTEAEDGINVLGNYSRDASSAKQIARAAQKTIAEWCYENDKTYIDGGKIYTGTITAQQIDVKELASLNATIGGFTIGLNTLSYESESSDISAFPKIIYTSGSSVASETKITEYAHNSITYIDNGYIAAGVANDDGTTTYIYTPIQHIYKLTNTGIIFETRKYTVVNQLPVASDYYDENLTDSYVTEFAHKGTGGLLINTSAAEVNSEKGFEIVGGLTPDVINQKNSSPASTPNTFQSNLRTERYVQTANATGYQCLDVNGTYRGIAAINADDNYVLATGAIQNSLYIGSFSETSEECTQSIILRGNNSVQFRVKSAVRPYDDSRVSLGLSSYRWTNIYATNGTIQTSDKNLKKNIEELDEKYINFFFDLIPKSFEMIQGTSGRKHMGFIAQEVEDAMIKHNISDLEFAGFCKDIKTVPILVCDAEYDEDGNEVKPDEYKDEIVYDSDGKPEYIYSLRYEEFIAINVAVTQRQQETINHLIAENIEFREMLDTILSRLIALEK